MSESPGRHRTGIVLAGGRSVRFGRDKLAEPLGERPLLHHPILALAEVCDEVVVVLAPTVEAPPMPTGVDVTIARDAEPDRGPLAGLAAGLAAATNEVSVVVGGDMPGLQPDVLREMVRACRETRAVAVALSDGGRERPLPIVVGTRPAQEAARRLLADDRRRLRDLLAEVRTVVIDEPTWTALDPERRTLVDVDEPSDLEGGR
jgi:molybdopterin-guanine dinucleotide biosynthesis protein A